MTTVGEILATARREKKLTIDQVEKATKIRGKFILALEKNEFQQLPPGTFAKGFIKNYSAFLGLPVEEILAFYRRQTSEEKTPILPQANWKQDLGFKPKWDKLSFTSIAIFILVVIFVGYLGYSYFYLAGTPALVIDSPVNNTVVSSEQIEMAGKTDPDAKLSINDQPVPISETGSFMAKITLRPGINSLTITAVNKFGRQTKIIRNLRLEKER